MPDNLFENFPKFSEKEWKQLIQFDLKGADYNRLLVWESLEGIKVQPFYHRDSFEYLDIPLPDSEFQIGQKVYLAKIDIAGKIGRHHLKNGVDVVEYKADRNFRPAELFKFFHSLDKPHHIHFFFSAPDEKILYKLNSYKSPHRIKAYVDNIGQLARYGNWWKSEEEDFQIMQGFQNNFPEFFIPLVNATHYHESGANIVQQIAFALSHAWEYVHKLPKLHTIRFHFAQGSNYFFEIAKLRAFRYLWQLLNEKHGLNIQPEITALPGRRNKTLYDPYVNMLRSLPEVMSAVLGGADRVFNLPYDDIYARSNDFSSRIARNQLLLLKEENDFHGAQHYVKGSYYIEKITLQLAEKSLKLFQQIEDNNGFINNLKNASIQDKIQKAAHKEQQWFDEGKITLLGTNIYPNEEEKIKPKIELFPFLKNNKRRTLIQPLLPKRLSEKAEQQRLNQETEN
jgi:methylmalonyl-CoA mutase